MRSRITLIIGLVLVLLATQESVPFADMGQWHNPNVRKIVGPDVSACDMILAWPGDAVISTAAQKNDPTEQDGVLQYEILDWATHVGLKSRHGVIFESRASDLQMHPAYIPLLLGPWKCPHYMAGGARAATYDEFLEGTYNPNYKYFDPLKRVAGTPDNHRVAHVYGKDYDGKDYGGNPITPQMRRRAEGYAWLQVGEWPYHDYLGHRSGGKDTSTADNAATYQTDPSHGDVWEYGGNYSLGYFNINLPWLPQYCSSLVYWAWNLGSTATDSTDYWRNGYGWGPTVKRIKGNDLGWRMRPHLNFARHAAWKVDNHEAPSWAAHALCELYDEVDLASPKDKDDVAAWIMGQAYGWLRWDNFYDPDVWVRGAEEISTRYNQGFEQFFHDLHDTNMSLADFGDKWFYPQNASCYSSGTCQRQGDKIRGFPPFDLVNERHYWEFGENKYLVEDYSGVDYEQRALWQDSSEATPGHRRDDLYERQLWNADDLTWKCTSSLIENPFFHYTDQAFPYGFSELRSADGKPEILFKDRSGVWSQGKVYSQPVFQIKNDMNKLAPADTIRWYGRYEPNDWQFFDIFLPSQANQITEVWVHYRADIEPGSVPGKCDYDYVELSLGKFMPSKRICGWNHRGISKLNVKNDATSSYRNENPDSIEVTFVSDITREGVGFAIEKIEIKVQDYREDLLGWDDFDRQYGWKNNALCYRCYYNARVNDGWCDPCLIYCGVGDTHPTDPNYKDPRKPQDGYDCLPPKKRNTRATIVDEMSHIAYMLVKETPSGMFELLTKYGDGWCDPKLLILMGDDDGDCDFPHQSIGSDFFWPVFRTVTKPDFDW
jgi:hypothetical protein